MDNNYVNLKAYFQDKHSIFKEIVEDFLKTTPLTDFFYERYYPGGKHLSFSTHSDYMDYVFGKKTHSLGKDIYEPVVKSKMHIPNHFIWPLEPSDEILRDAYGYNLWNGCSIFIRKKVYVDSYHFLGNRQQNSLVNFYINNLPKLHQFIKEFDEKAKKIITNDKKVLGQHFGEYILTDFEDNKTNLNFTSREMECLELIAAGYGRKSIAHKLSISPRTIETYVKALKSKTNLFSREHLVKFYYNSFYS